MPRVKLLIGLDDAYGRAVTRGVIRYAKGRPDWKLFGYGRIFPEPPEDGPGEGMAEAGRAAPQPTEGIIARAETAEEARRLANLGIPVVDVACAYPGAGLLEAYNDDEETGRRAGEYLRDLGFSYFAATTCQGTLWSRRRMLSFLRTLDKPRGEVSLFERPLPWWKDRQRETWALEAWLRRLPLPTAIFAGNDIAGLKIIEACGRAGISVPEEIAVLGVDDEDLLCELADPSLSSIRLDCEGIGMAAAALLEKAMAGLAEPERADADSPGLGLGKALEAKFAPGLGMLREAKVAPGTVVERDSTRTMVHGDSLIVQALTWLRINHHRTVDVADLIRALPACRRTVEKRFRTELGKSPRQVLEDLRMDRAKQLLAATDLTMEDVARQCGFSVPARFYRIFKQQTGLAPGAWRRDSGR
jgi:LacI family transcriptional regulator